MNEQQLPVSLFLAGRARTKGHIQPVHIPGRGGRPCVYGQGKDRPVLIEWMKSMGRQIQDQLGIQMVREGRGKAARVRRVDAAPYSGPVYVSCIFLFDREQSQAEAAEGGQVWESHASDYPTAMSIGDIDTLWRAVNDALVKNGVIKDDRLIVSGTVSKRWTREGETAGVFVHVMTKWVEL